MNCEKAKGLLVEYVDGELDAALRDELEDHLRSCSTCRQTKETLAESSVEPFREAQKVKAPEYLWHSIRDRIEKRPSGTSVLDLAFERILLPLRARKPAFALATAVVALLVTIALMRLPGERPSMAAAYMQEQAEFFIYLAGDNGAGSSADLTSIGTDIEEYLL